MLADMQPVLAIIVPCYYEEEVLPSTAETLGKLLEVMVSAGEVAENSYVCFVNDGSQDRTWPIICELRERSPRFCGINLSRNFGHQSALLAGLFTAEADAYVSIDADLQDDENAIREMVRFFREGKDIVYGCRDNRETDTWFKRTTAQAFYGLRAAMGCQTIPNHADYRLMSRRSVNELRRFCEVNLYLRGIIPMLGFPSEKVYYKRKARELGESKYPFIKMLRLAWDGVVNFSDFPLLFMVWAGVVGFLMSLALIAWSVFQWYTGHALPGWTSTVSIVAAFSSLQFLFIGIIGLYIGKIFRETKRRPIYVVQDDTTPKGAL